MNKEIEIIQAKLGQAKQWLRDHNDIGQLDIIDDPMQTMSFMRGKVFGLRMALQVLYDAKNNSNKS